MPAAPTTSHPLPQRAFGLRWLVVVGVFAVAVVGVGGGLTGENVSSVEPVATLVPAKADGLASFSVAPKTWSSRAQVRWKARMGSEARYVV